MPLGEGFWLCRWNGKMIEINDHAADVCANPQKFGLTDKALIEAVSVGGREHRISEGHVVVRNEEDRELLIPRICLEGFIRVRDHRGTLGWQFAGDPITALDALRRYGKKRLGPLTLVTFTDFGLNLSVTDHYDSFTKDAESQQVKHLIDTWIRRYEGVPR